MLLLSAAVWNIENALPIIEEGIVNADECVNWANACDDVSANYFENSFRLDFKEFFGLPQPSFISSCWNFIDSTNLCGHLGGVLFARSLLSCIRIIFLRRDSNIFHILLPKKFQIKLKKIMLYVSYQSHARPARAAAICPVWTAVHQLLGC